LFLAYSTRNTIYYKISVNGLARSADKAGMAASDKVIAFTSADSRSPAEGKAVDGDVSKLFLGSSQAMTQLLEQIRRVAPYFRTALLTGERDSGEEEAAHALHQFSPLSGLPFVELTPSNAEARLSQRGPPGSELSEGMIYLPRPERIPQSVQQSLLRLLRERGPNAPRLVAFAERGLRSLVSMGAFSAELADSLGALRIVLPPLRERQEDIPLLLTAMVREQAEQLGASTPQLGADLLHAASRQTWPGNFGQLRSVAANLVKRSGSRPLCAAELETVLGTMPVPPRRDRREIRMISLDRIIHEHIRAVLFACNGNKLRAAEVLGISRSTLYRMLESKMPGDSTALPHVDDADSAVEHKDLPLTG
jgi:DNA-binding NtrC family response regulator